MPSKVHYKEAGHGSCENLIISGIEHIEMSSRGGDG